MFSSEENQPKCDCIEGSVTNNTRQLFFTIALEKVPCFKTFREQEPKFFI